MPLNAMRRCEPMLDRVIRPLKPARVIAEVGRGDRASYFRNFKGYRVDKFGRPRIEKIARKEMFERGNEFWAQLLIVLWNEANRDLYIKMRDYVATIDEDVEKVERIEDEQAEQWLAELLEDWALEDVLICTYLNEVRFTDAFVRQRMEAPLEIERPADDLFGADAPMPERDDEEAEDGAESD